MPQSNESAPRKLFAEERKLIARGIMPPPEWASDGRQDEILAAIQELTSAVGELRARLDADQIDVAGGEAMVGEATQSDAAVRTEIARMVRNIGQAKREIAAIKHPMAETDQVEAASTELDAIVRATEEATGRILESGEAIMKLTGEIAAYAADDPDLVAKVDHIEAHLTRVFEACNFQDITGQRITKVVKTLRFIEQRIINLIGIWGVDAFLDLPIQQDPRSEEEQLLEGPQLENQGLSQADIDALFS